MIANINFIHKYVGKNAFVKLTKYEPHEIMKLMIKLLFDRINPVKTIIWSKNLLNISTPCQNIIEKMTFFKTRFEKAIKVTEKTDILRIHKEFNQNIYFDYFDGFSTVKIYEETHGYLLRFKLKSQICFNKAIIYPQLYKLFDDYKISQIQ